MKHINVIALIALCCLNTLSAQEFTQKTKLYKTWVYLNTEPFKVKGVLYEVTDSTLLVSNSLVIQDYNTNKFEVVKLNVSNIEEIEIRRKNSIINGVFIGALSGFALGGMIGLISGDDPPCPSRALLCLSFSAGEKALLAGIPLSIVGAGFGALAGSFKIIIPIDGNNHLFNANKNRLKEYSIKKQKEQ